MEDTAPEDNDPFNEEREDNDPFSPSNVQILQFIMMSRIYDVLMADLTKREPEIAKQILDLHREGKLLGTPPNMSGEFLAADPD